MKGINPQFYIVIAEAQTVKFYTIGQVNYQRIPHGGNVRCKDCAVKPGQLHVPCCDKEVCPNCDCQLISCDCKVTIPSNEKMSGWLQTQKESCWRLMGKI
jgi:hypothetical protein